MFEYYNHDAFWYPWDLLLVGIRGKPMEFDLPLVCNTSVDPSLKIRTLCPPRLAKAPRPSAIRLPAATKKLNAIID